MKREIGEGLSLMRRSLNRRPKKNFLFDLLMNGPEGYCADRSQEMVDLLKLF